MVGRTLVMDLQRRVDEYYARAAAIGHSDEFARTILDEEKSRFASVVVADSPFAALERASRRLADDPCALAKLEAE